MKTVRFILAILVLSFFAGLPAQGQNLKFEGVIRMRSWDEGSTKKPEAFNMYFHDGKVCIDSVDAGGEKVRIIVDINGKMLYVISQKDKSSAFSASFAELSEIASGALSSFMPKDTQEFAGDELKILSTATVKQIQNYSCKKFIINKKEKGEAEAPAGEIWATTGAGITLQDLKPVYDLCLNMSFFKQIRDLIKAVPADFDTTFPLDITLTDNDAGKKKEISHIRFTIHKGLKSFSQFDTKGIEFKPLSDVMKALQDSKE